MRRSLIRKGFPPVAVPGPSLSCGARCGLYRLREEHGGSAVACVCLRTGLQGLRSHGTRTAWNPPLLVSVPYTDIRVVAFALWLLYYVPALGQYPRADEILE